MGEGEQEEKFSLRWGEDTSTKLPRWQEEPRALQWGLLVVGGGGGNSLHHSSPVSQAGQGRSPTWAHGWGYDARGHRALSNMC